MTRASPDSQDRRRDDARAQFAALSRDADRAAPPSPLSSGEGLPTRRNEAWHYTDLRSAADERGAARAGARRGAIEAARALLATRARIGDVRFVMVDGRFVARTVRSRRRAGCPAVAESAGARRGPTPSSR